MHNAQASLALPRSWRTATGEVDGGVEQRGMVPGAAVERKTGGRHGG
jgi:hypothetical protein